MTSPRVVELPRRLEPVAPDTFLSPVDADAPRLVSYLGNVVALRPRDELAMRRLSRQPAPPAAA
jgi:hypothetical protein